MRHVTLVFLALIALAMAQPAHAQYESTSEYRAGYERGHIAGVDFASEPGAEPNFDFISRMNGIMQQATPSNREAWRRGWLKGAQDGFRGIKPSKREAGAYQPLSAAVARPHVKLYSYAETHEATVVSVDIARDRMTVRYTKSRGTEAKSISALSSQWFVKKNDPALKRKGGGA
jgi:hypothetical protein